MAGYLVAGQTAPMPAEAVGAAVASVAPAIEPAPEPVRGVPATRRGPQGADPPKPVTERELTGDCNKEASRTPDPTPVTEGAVPRYVCESPRMTLQPVWEGKPIEATWVVKNEGEGDLKIKIKKG
jgi:hypothetical protein